MGVVLIGVWSRLLVSYIGHVQVHKRVGEVRIVYRTHNASAQVHHVWGTTWPKYPPSCHAYALFLQDPVYFTDIGSDK